MRKHTVLYLTQLKSFAKQLLLTVLTNIIQKTFNQQASYRFKHVITIHKLKNSKKKIFTWPFNIELHTDVHTKLLSLVNFLIHS